MSEQQYNTVNTAQKRSIFESKSRNNLNSYIYQQNIARPSTAFLSLGRKQSEVSRATKTMNFFINATPTKQIAPKTSVIAHRAVTLKQKGVKPKHDVDFERYKSVA